MNNEMIADAKFSALYQRYLTKPMDEAMRAAILSRRLDLAA